MRRWTVQSQQLVGFDLGTRRILSNGPLTYILVTNTGTYRATVPVPNVNDRLKRMRFFGFIASEGEVFTQFSFTSNAAPVLDNVTLGERNSVPEPASLALVGLALVGLAALGRRTPA